MFRQGDVLLVRVDAVPAEARRRRPENGRLILARGEATGHHHSVAATKAALLTTADDVYLRIMAATPLEHQEHAPIWLQPGAYRVVRQREYAPQGSLGVQD